MRDYSEVVINGELYPCPDIVLAHIAELTEESAQWQESCGQNFVRAEQAEDRVNWFEQENDRLHKRIAELEDEREADDAAIEDHITALHEQIARQKTRIAELEDECGKLRSLLRDDRDCWARNEELEARNAKLEAALEEIRDYASWQDLEKSK